MTLAIHPPLAAHPKGSYKILLSKEGTRIWKVSCSCFILAFGFPLPQPMQVPPRHPALQGEGRRIWKNSRLIIIS